MKISIFSKPEIMMNEPLISDDRDKGFFYIFEIVGSPFRTPSCETIIKIGSTIDPKQRLQQHLYTTANMIDGKIKRIALSDLCAGFKEYEKQLHKAFSDKVVSGVNARELFYISFNEALEEALRITENCYEIEQKRNESLSLDMKKIEFVAKSLSMLEGQSRQRMEFTLALSSAYLDGIKTGEMLAKENV